MNRLWRDVGLSNCAGESMQVSEAEEKTELGEGDLEELLWLS